MINEPTNEQKAILNYNGNTVVTANPGSGKTYTVVEKIGKVLHDLPSYKGIIAISFTNKASDELKKRCKRKGINAKSSFFGTIDKFYISEIIIPFASHLTHVMPEYQVVESTETEKHYSELGMITENVTKEQGALLKEALCKGKIFLNISGEMAWYIMCNVPGVRKYMQSRYSHVFIDEYQDCGKIQHDIFLALCEMGIIGVAVGDVNQAIYGFTNRFPRYLLELIGKDDFEHFELSKNHRCHPSISEYSLCLYGISKEIIEDKRIFRVSVDGNEVNIAKKIDLAIPKIKRKYNVANNNQIAILCRNNGTIKILDQAIETPHKVFAETPLDRDNSEWGRLFRSLLVAKFDQEIFPVDYAEQLFSEEYDPEKYREVLKACDIIFNSSTEELADVIIEFEKVAELVYPGKKNKKAKELLDAIIADDILLENYIPPQDNEITIMTLHKSKGLEFNVVFHMDMYKYTEIYFNPSATKGEIDKSKINQRVKFGIGFSYDGPRAYNSSIQLMGKEDVEEVRNIETGMIIKCEVIKNVAFFTQVRLVGYSEEVGSIHIDELSNPFNRNHRPSIGSVFEVKVLNQKFDNKTQRNIWMLTMNVSGSSDEEREETAMAKALKNIKL